MARTETSESMKKTATTLSFGGSLWKLQCAHLVVEWGLYTRDLQRSIASCRSMFQVTQRPLERTISETSGKHSAAMHRDPQRQYWQRQLHYLSWYWLSINEINQCRLTNSGTPIFVNRKLVNIIIIVTITDLDFGPWLNWQHRENPRHRGDGLRAASGPTWMCTFSGSFESHIRAYNIWNVW